MIISDHDSQSSHGFATSVNVFATKTKALAREIPPATQASAGLSLISGGEGLSFV